jgi:hypothetical protein
VVITRITLLCDNATLPNRTSFLAIIHQIEFQNAMGLRENYRGTGKLSNFTYRTTCDGPIVSGLITSTGFLLLLVNVHVQTSAKNVKNVPVVSIDIDPAVSSVVVALLAPFSYICCSVANPVVANAPGFCWRSCYCWLPYVTTSSLLFLTSLLLLLSMCLLWKEIHVHETTNFCSDFFSILCLCVYRYSYTRALLTTGGSFRRAL